jgi:hypothetical protein
VEEHTEEGGRRMEEEGGRKRKREGQEQGLFNHWCKRGIVLNSTDSRLLLSIVDDASGRPSGNTVGVAAARAEFHLFISRTGSDA